MRRTVGRVLLAVVAVGLLGAAGGTPIAKKGASGQESVIVQGRNAAAAVRDAGGTTTLALDLIGGVGATVPTTAIASLEAQGLIVSPDAKGHVVSDGFGGPAPVNTNPQLQALNLPTDPNAGHGVAVALLDTGVANTPDLNGRLIRGPDLSGERDGIDRFGHGTFMAGLIAGDGTGSPPGSLHQGAAPGATVVSIKVAGADGSTNLSKVIAGIGWAVVHQGDYNIRVLNLSVGVDPSVPYRQDPLSAAVQIAWASGLTTVVAAGNDGAGMVTAPGRDPYVLTVGAADNTISSDPAFATMPAWSGTKSWSSPEYSKPDVLAPGVSVVSLRAPGSTIDTRYPEARVDENYFRGSGTSMSTALTSGMAAIVVQHHPDAAPDDVKGAITSTATPVPAAGISAGEVDLAAALTAPADPAWEQHWKTTFSWLRMPWEHNGWSSTRWSSTRWSGSEWSSTRWSSTRWSSQMWERLFESTRWSDMSWDSTRWSSTRWSSATWGDNTPSLVSTTP
jgi:serine protease AprX